MTASHSEKTETTLVATPTQERSELLLKIAQAVAAHADLGELLRDLASALENQLPAGYISFALIDPQTHGGKLQYLEPVGPVEPPAPADTPSALPVHESPTAVVWRTQEPLWLDISESGSEASFPILRAAYERQGVKVACFVPLTTPRRRLGAIGINSYAPRKFEPADVEFAIQIGRLVALAVEATLARQELESEKEHTAQERDRFELLFEIGLAAAARLDLTGLASAVTAGLGKHAGFPDAQLLLPESASLREGMAAEAFRTSVTTSDPPAIFLPLICGGATVGVLRLVARDADGFDPEKVELFEAVARTVAVAVANAQAYRQIEELTARLAAEKHYLEEEIRTEWSADEMIGGRSLGEVLQQADVVAPTDSAVLITGETGTGKELIARAIHRRSNRSRRTFVKLNCAAIPTGLLESELFGHEKGAFTGAVDRRIGRFELADGGTLFLDEVGDIPLELQPKLLRVLQEQEFERLGSSKTLKVDVRLIAATHRDLAKMVADGKFRADLYYRLHVFPIQVPPLRERREDIPILVRHFVQTFARRFSRTIDSIPSDAMAALERYPWPGNVRELEHMIERAVILTSGGALRVPTADLVAHTATLNPATVSSGRGTLSENERELIARTLEECGGTVGGPNGAAAKLGLKRTTLISRMKKFGLDRPSRSGVE